MASPNNEEGSHVFGSQQTAEVDGIENNPPPPQQPQPPQQQQDAQEDGNSLDHALLESIFYNEMLALDDSASLISSSLLSTLAADGSVLQQLEEELELSPTSTTEPPPEQKMAATLPKDAVPLLPHASGVEPPQTPQQLQQNPQQPTASATAAAPLATIPTISSSSGIVHSVVPVAVARGSPSGPTKPSTNKKKTPQPKKKAPPKTQQSARRRNSNTQQKKTTTAAPALVASATVETTSNTAPVSLPASAHPSASPTPLDLEDGEKRQKLVTQFAALAARLGIRLPEPVVQSLTANNDDTQTIQPVATATATVSSSAGATTVSSSAPSTPPSAAAKSSATTHNPQQPQLQNPPPVLVQQLAKAADAAVEAASRKRSANNSGGAGSDGGENSGDGGAAEQGSTAAATSTKQAPYSKRRKKPRLQDCESKLSELQAENATLKRHLANLSSQSQAMDQERSMQEQRMKLMLEQEDGDLNELNDSIQNFQALYSDYGHRRQQELEFHLDQLQRLANPTNFTKLGLWTMGGGGSSLSPSSDASSDTSSANTKKKNPIASILQKELDINPSQGRKILEQRQKIQHVCNNLKECLNLLAKLKALCQQKTKIFHNRMNKCREILTPKQVVKLILWINQHASVLDQVCPGWGSEHLRTKTI